MLPEYLVNSYQRYKEDTAIFTTWLSKTAQQCGYKPQEIRRGEPRPEPKPANPAAAGGTRLKGNARKEAKMAGKSNSGNPISPAESQAPLQKVAFVVTTRELLAQAEAIAASVASAASIEMPKGIQRIAQRAIETRKRFATWYESDKNCDADALAKHEHFIQILQQSLDILAPSSTPQPNESDTLDASKAVVLSTAESAEIPSLANRFEALDLEDPSMEDIQMTSLDVSRSISSNTKTKKAKSGSLKADEYDVYEVQDDKYNELTFAAYCLFEDMHASQDFLEELWISYSENKIDYITAAFITNVSFEMIRVQEKSIIDEIGPEFFVGKLKGGTYLVLSYIFHSPDSTQSEDVWDEESTYADPMTTDYMYLPTARILSKFRPEPTDEESEEGLSETAGQKSRISYLINRLSFLYDDDDDDGIEEIEGEDELLSQIILDCILMDDLKETMTKEKLPNISYFTAAMEQGEDVLRSGLRTVYLDGAVDAWTVFSCEVLLDIHKTLAASSLQSLPYRSLVLETENNINLLHTHRTLFEGLTSQLKRVDSKDRKYIKEYEPFLKHGVQAGHTFFAAYKTRHVEYRKEHVDPGLDDLEEKIQEDLALMDRQTPLIIQDEGEEQQIMLREVANTKPIQQNDREEFLYENNPLYGGTLGLNIRTNFLKNGLALANNHLAIFGMAHLYNALVQLDILGPELRWPLMDKVIELHMTKFFGMDLPKTPADCHKRMALKMGFSARTFASDSRGVTTRNGGKDYTKSPSFMEMDPISEALSEHAAGNTTLSVCMSTLHDALSKNAATSSENKKRNPPPRLSQLDFLHELEATLPQVLEDANIDYITLSHLCGELLYVIRSLVHESTDFKHKEGDEKATRGHDLVAMVHTILFLYSGGKNYNSRRVQIRANNRENNEDGVHPVLDMQLIYAGRVLEQYIEIGAPMEWWEAIKRLRDMNRENGIDLDSAAVRFPPEYSMYN